MEFVWLLIFFFVGLMVASFTIIPVLIILFFGIPLTNKLEKRGLLKKNGIKKGYMLNLIIFPLIFLGVWWAITNFFPAGTIGFYIGTGASLLLVSGRLEPIRTMSLTTLKLTNDTSLLLKKKYSKQY